MATAKFWLPSGYFELREPLTMEQIDTILALMCKHYPCEPDPAREWRYQQVMDRIKGRGVYAPRKRK